MSPLKKLLQDLSRELDRVLERNSTLEKQLETISGALGAGTMRLRAVTASRGRTPGRTRRGAPTRFSDADAAQLRKEYELGATAAELAKRHQASLPTILKTLRRAGTSVRRGRQPKKRAPRRG